MRRLIVSFLAAGLLAVAGCGGGDGESGKVAPDRYASSVCASIATWQTALTSASTVLAQRTSRTRDLKTVRRQFISFFDGALTQTDRMVAAVAEVGVPDVEQGDTVAAALLRDLRRFRPILVEARDKARKLPLDDATSFATRAQSLGTRFQIEANGLATEFQALDEKYSTPELRQAADDDATCRNL
jgi:hypothetical protein